MGVITLSALASNGHRRRGEALPDAQRADVDGSLDFLAKIANAPIAGHGTGSIPEQLRSAVSPETGIASIGTVNPHNEIFVAAIQLGLLGTAALFAMWGSHLLLFRGDGPIAWTGLVAVVQNVVGCLANSHVTDFTQGWLYVFAVGTLGGMILRRAVPSLADA